VASAEWLKKAKAKAKAPIQRRRRAAPARKPPAPGADALPPVILLHGILLTRHTLWPLMWRLRRRGRRVWTIPYQSTLHDIPECAHRVALRLKALGIREFDAVTFSMGGIVLRWAMNNEAMPRLRRVVMIGPPNSGSHTADTLHRWLGPVFPLVWGAAGLQLRRNPQGVAGRAGLLPGAELGILVGGSGTPRGLPNPFRIPGDNDGIVGVEESIIRGMKDIVQVNASHRTIYLRGRTAELAHTFLEHGVFRPDAANDTDGEKEEG